MSTLSRVSPILPVRRRAARLSGEARRAQIITAACQFFAENGFAGPTRDLAASLGITQALLYRYFDSKTELIDAVFAEVFRRQWSLGALDRLHATAGAPMVERVAAVYEGLLSSVTSTATRLFFRAGLDAYAGPIYRSAAENWPVGIALLQEWRREEGLPTLAVTPLLQGERALMTALHDAMIMIRVREFVLGLPAAMGDAEEIRQIAETFDAGVRVVLRTLHAGQAGPGRLAPAEEAQAAA